MHADATGAKFSTKDHALRAEANLVDIETPPISGDVGTGAASEIGGGGGGGGGGRCAAASGAADCSHNSSHAWMDAGSVWSSVQRHGEELQRRQREEQQQQQPLTRRRSYIGTAAAAAAFWSCGQFQRLAQRMRTQLIVTARVAAKDPYAIVVPLLLLICMLALGLWGVFSVGNTIRDGRREAALNAATDFSNTLKSHIAATVAPASTVKTLVELNPDWPSINKTFHAVAPSLVQKGRETDAVLTIVLCPQGIASAIVPTGLPAWSQVYGLDLLKTAAWRNDALKTVLLHEQGMVMTGPSRLRAGMMGIVTRYAVFISGAGPDETFGFNGSAYNCTPCYQPPSQSGTGSSIDNNSAAVGKRFWGFAQLNVDWEMLIRNITRMYDLCERDNLSFNMTYIDPVSYINRSIAACGGNLGPDPVFVHIDTMANHWVLAVSDARGWTPEWLPLVVAVVVVVSLWVAVAMAILLINRREHMWLLQAMLPKKVIATLRRGEEYAEAFQSVTVLFSDIVSYTTLASEMEPIKVVRLLNEMYSEYDALVDQFECYKVETIGDAFMAVCGTQGEDAVAAAVKVGRLAQAMIEKTRVLVSADGQKIRIRVGLHSGPVVGAVVGFKMPHFCLCGDTVNTASRMESNSKPMRIHISDSTAALLRASDEGFKLERRGVIQIKGKGPMLTHWLLTESEVAEAEAVAAAAANGGGGCQQLGTAAGEAEAAAAAGTEEAPPLLVDPLADAAVVGNTWVAAAAAAAAAEELDATRTVPDMPSLLSSALGIAAGHTSYSGTPLSGGGGGTDQSCASSPGNLANNVRRRLSEFGNPGGGGGGGGSRFQPTFLPGRENNNNNNNNSGGGGVSYVEAGGSCGGAVSMTCSGSGAATTKKHRTSVDLRLFQSHGRRSKPGK